MKEKRFLVIVINERQVRSGWWTVAEQRLTAQEQSTAHGYQDDKSCVVAVDRSLQELGKATENISQVLFGFEPAWADAAGVIDAKKGLLKEVTKELSIEPVGFVVVPEAIMQELKASNPLSPFLLVYITAKDVQVSWLQAGKPTVTEIAGNSKNIVADVTEVLARIKNHSKDAARHWPTKIVLASQELDGMALEQAQQALIQAKWSQDAGFVQPPAVEVVNHQQLVQIVVMQGGKAVASAQGLEVADQQTPVLTFGGQSAQSLAQATGQTAHDAEATAESFGFSEPTPAALAAEEEQPKSFGIPMPWHKVAAVTKPEVGPLTAEPENALPTYPPSGPIHHQPVSKSTKHPSKLQRWWKHHWHVVSMGFAGGMLALLGIGWFFLLTQTQAIVKITVKTEPVAASAQIVVDPSLTQSNLEAGVLAGKVMSTPVQGSAAVRTTGTKLVGEKAKGQVILVNKTDAPKSFSAGTTLSVGQLAFSLDKDVTVASASVSSSSDGETRTYGKSEVEVTAKAIGEDSNVAKDAEFKVADFASSTYVANAKDAFKGGTSRELKTITDKDRETVLAQLKTELLKQAETKFKAETPAGQYSLPTGKLSISKATYSGKTGDEAEEIALEITAAAEAVTYQIAEMQPLAKAVLSQKIATGYELLDQNPEVLTTQAPGASSSGLLKLEANFSSKVKPVLNLDQLKKELVGQHQQKAIQFLQSKQEVKAAEVQFSPGFIKFVRPVLPKSESRLQIEIVTP